MHFFLTWSLCLIFSLCVCTSTQRMHVPFQLSQRSQMFPHRPLSQRGGAGPPVHPTLLMRPKFRENNISTNSGGLLLPLVNIFMVKYNFGDKLIRHRRENNCQCWTQEAELIWIVLIHSCYFQNSSIKSFPIFCNLSYIEMMCIPAVKRTHTSKEVGLLWIFTKFQIQKDWGLSLKLHYYQAGTEKS